MNIIKLLEDELPPAIEELEEKISLAYETIRTMESKLAQLQRIAHAVSDVLPQERSFALRRFDLAGLTGADKESNL